MSESDFHVVELQLNQEEYTRAEFVANLGGALEFSVTNRPRKSLSEYFSAAWLPWNSLCSENARTTTWEPCKKP